LLNLDIAKRLQKAKTFFETIEFDRDTGEISFDPISIAPRQINLEKNNDIILSFFEEGKPAPLLKDIADALGVTEGSARGLIQRLRKKTGRELNVLFVKKEPTTTRKLLPASKNNLKIKNQKILSLFEDSKVPPSIQDMMDATGLKRAGAYRRLEDLRKTTGQKLILDKPIGDTRKSVIARVEETNKTILSLFKNGEQSPTIEEISKATGLSPGAVSNRLIKLRKSSGQELIVKPKNSKKPKLVVERKPGDTSKEEKKTPDELVLSLFKDSKTPPTMQEIVRELGVSYPAAKERLKRLRQKTGMALSITPVPAMPILNDAINQQLLSLFENNKNITTEQIAKATGLSVSAIKGRLVRLRKETGKELSISRELPPSLRDDISKTILSFFEEGKSAPTRQQLVDATGLSADGVTGRLQKLRKATGEDLSLEKNLPWSTTDDISKTILSFFKDGGNPPTHQQLMEATGLSASALTVRLSKLRKETGERLPLTIKRPFKGRTTMPKLEIIPPKEK
jgi:DNA-binding Lrp family transcriptional regulator